MATGRLLDPDGGFGTKCVLGTEDQNVNINSHPLLNLYGKGEETSPRKKLVATPPGNSHRGTGRPVNRLKPRYLVFQNRVHKNKRLNFSDRKWSPSNFYDYFSDLKVI